MHTHGYITGSDLYPPVPPTLIPRVTGGCREYTHAKILVELDTRVVEVGDVFHVAGRGSYVNHLQHKF